MLSDLRLLIKETLSEQIKYLEKHRYSYRIKKYKIGNCLFTDIELLDFYFTDGQSIITFDDEGILL